LRSADTGARESSSKHFTTSLKPSDVDSKIFQRERAELDARERILVKREQVVLAQAKELNERSRVLAVAENAAKEQRMKGLIAAEKLGRAHVHEVAAASSTMQLLADDVRGTSDALNALLCGVQALTDVENGHRLRRQVDHLDEGLLQLDHNARELEVRGNQQLVADVLSLEAPGPSCRATNAAAAAVSAEWRASPHAASLDDDEAALWDRLTIEQLEVLQNIYHTHSKVQHSQPHLFRASCCLLSFDRHSMS
jgi:hypothetical protein